MVKEVSGAARRPAPEYCPPPSRPRPPLPPPPYTGREKDTMVSASPKGHWWSGWSPKALWRRSVDSVRGWWETYKPTALWDHFSQFFLSLFDEFIDFFTESGIPIKKSGRIRLQVGEVYPIRCDGCDHLCLALRFNGKRDLEILGLRYIAKGEEGPLTLKTFDELVDEEVETCQEEFDTLLAGVGRDTPYKRLLEEVIDFAKERAPGVVLRRELDQTDISFVVEYMGVGFDTDYDVEFLRLFEERIAALKGRLYSLLFDDAGAPRSGLLFNAACKRSKNKSDLAEFRLMLSFMMVDGQAVDASTYKDSELHQLWDFWTQVDYRPEYAVALALDLGKETKPSDYEGISYSLQIPER